ncbi:hypothetical protein F5876DRAFT_75657 [Lentinula aff. lateritia]|uniref:Uncharacterized protein n=1 Tax=Lentinula aff. lateritia TaxID=2804960 RepID=A0ACC1U3J6_9AGAR|nr:hypothetical protein F5876DRAFT_75657 [Lentinula aff. lateritia]
MAIITDRCVNRRFDSNRNFRNVVLFTLLASTLVSFCNATPINLFRNTRKDVYDPQKEVLIGFGYSRYIGISKLNSNHTLHLPAENLFATQRGPQEPRVLNPVISLLQRGDFEDEFPAFNDRGRTGLFPYNKCYVTLTQRKIFDDLKDIIIYSSLPSRLPSYSEGSTRIPSYEQSRHHKDSTKVVTVTSGEHLHAIMHFPFNPTWLYWVTFFRIRCIPQEVEFPEGIEDARWQDWNIPNWISEEKDEGGQSSEVVPGSKVVDRSIQTEA